MAVLSTADQNNLPDSAFAYIEGGGQKDGDGKTVPRSLRHFCIADAPHVRDALARMAQGAKFADQARPAVLAAAKRMGVAVAGQNAVPEYILPERRFTPGVVDIRDAQGGKRIIGYGSVFDKLSRNLGGFVENVRTTAFNKSRSDGWPSVVCRYNHDPNMLLGTVGGGTVQLSVDDYGLRYDVLPPQSRADILELVQRGDVRHSSFAFRVPPGGDEWSVTDQSYPMRSLIAVELVDVAPVVDPAYPDATAGLRSLAERFGADLTEVMHLAQADELRKFFTRTDGPQPKPAAPRREFGPAAALKMRQRQASPLDENVA